MRITALCLPPLLSQINVSPEGTSQAAQLPGMPPSTIPTWKADRFVRSVEVHNYEPEWVLIPVPSAKPTGYDLPRKAMGQPQPHKILSRLHKVFPAQNRSRSMPNCECGIVQTMAHIIDAYPIYKAHHGFPGLHQELDDETIN